MDVEQALIYELDSRRVDVTLDRDGNRPLSRRMLGAGRLASGLSVVPKRDEAGGITVPKRDGTGSYLSRNGTAGTPSDLHPLDIISLVPVRLQLRSDPTC